MYSVLDADVFVGGFFCAVTRMLRLPITYSSIRTYSNILLSYRKFIVKAKYIACITRYQCTIRISKAMSTQKVRELNSGYFWNGT